MGTDKRQSYFRFNSYGLSKFAMASLEKVRASIFRIFMNESKINDSVKVLDVGVSPQENEAANYFERLFPFRNNLTALGLGDYTDLERIYPGIKYVKGDGTNLPFEDNSFDWVFSHAVIEHVGNRDAQLRFLREIKRVTRKGFFITTPNRGHPMEFHTGLPVLHYLPQKFHLWIYGLLGKTFYSSIDNLNLLYQRDLIKMANATMGDNFKIKLKNIKWIGFKSNLILIGEKS